MVQKDNLVCCINLFLSTLMNKMISHATVSLPVFQPFMMWSITTWSNTPHNEYPPWLYLIHLLNKPIIIFDCYSSHSSSSLGPSLAISFNHDQRPSSSLSLFLLSLLLSLLTSWRPWWFSFHLSHSEHSSFLVLLQLTLLRVRQLMAGVTANSKQSSKQNNQRSKIVTSKRGKRERFMRGGQLI